MTGDSATTPPGVWARDEIEHVVACPACAAGDSRPFYGGVCDPLRPEDAGQWDLSRCDACGAAYLSPRPVPDAIGRAYDVYFTHEPPPDPAPPGLLPAIRRAGVNGHLNRHLGYHGRPSSRLLSWLVRLVPGGRAHAQRTVRSVPAPPPGGCILDVGCANGAYLVAMRARGWRVQGVETDPQAITFARAAGIEVVEGVLDARIADASVDAVTLGHVIEHVHDPLALLLECRRVLRPGGTIWVATPNLDASGRRVFGEDYVQLDAPRHLVLFTRSALRALLARAGFTDVHEPPVVPHARAWTFPRSAAIRAGLGSHPDPLPPLPLRLRLRAALADLRALVTTSRTEELVLIARKPGV